MQEGLGWERENKGASREGESRWEVRVRAWWPVFGVENKLGVNLSGKNRSWGCAGRAVSIRRHCRDSL